MTPRPRRATSLLFALLLTFPATLAGGVQEVPLDAAPPRQLADVATLVTEALRPFDHGAFAAHVAPSYAPPSAQAAPSTEAQAHETLPVPASGETTWVNDSTVSTNGFMLPAGATLELRGSTLIVNATRDHHPRLFVPSGARLILTDTLVRSAGGDDASYYDIFVRGSLLVTDSSLASATGDWKPNNSADTVRVLGATFTGARNDIEVSGAGSLIERSLFYNYSSTPALVARDGANVRNSTFIQNDVAIEIMGTSPALQGNVLRFNRVGIQWSGAVGAIVSGNDIYDNYQDGLYGNGDAGETLDAAGNWWDGTPNVDGDSVGGSGASASSPRATRAAASVDRTSEVPFPLHSFKGDTTWPLGARLDGPVIARAGTLTIAGLPVLDVAGYRFGSHVAGRVHATGVEFRNHGIILSRSDDLFDGITIAANGTTGFRMRGVTSSAGGLGILVIAGSPTIQNARFSGVDTAIMQTPRSTTPPDTLSAFRVTSTTFDHVDVGVLATTASPTIEGSTFRNASIGVVCTLCASTVLRNDLFEGNTIGILDVLGQGTTITGSTVVDSQAGMVLLGSSSPTLSSLETRFNAFGVIALGTQATLVASQIYDDPLFGLYAAPLVLDGVSVPGRLRVDPTTYVGDATRGPVEFVPPQRTSPGATPGRLSNDKPVIIGGYVVLTGNQVASGPIVVRPGGLLTIRNATLDMRWFMLGVQPGGEIKITNASVSGGLGAIVHGGAPNITDARFTGQRYSGLTLVDDVGGRVRSTEFSDAPVGLTLWSSRALVQRSLLRAGPNDIGVAIVNDTSPTPPGPRLRENLFLSGSPAVQGQGNPAATLTNNSFRTLTAIDDGQRAVLGLVGQEGGAAKLDARGNWWNSTTGPRTIGGAGRGAWVFWPAGPPTVLFDNWRSTAYRAAFIADRTTAMTGVAVQFTDDSFDLDRAITARQWSFGDGTPNATAASPTHVYQTAGTYVVRLDVTDAYGWTSRAETTVTVKAAPNAALSAPGTILSLVNATLDASASVDPDGRIVAYRFQATDGYDSGFRSTPQVAHAFARPGVYGINVTVKDDEGYLSTPANASILVTNRAPNVTADVSKRNATRLDGISFWSNSTDLDGSIVNLTWDFADGTKAYVGNTTHRYAALGMYGARFTAKDDAGAASEVVVAIHVTNVPPIAEFTATPRIAHPESPFTFTSLARDADGPTPAVRWDFGDGNTSTSPVAQHAYAIEGDYVVQLVAVDADGATHTATRVAAVRVNIPPSANFTYLPSGGLLNTSTLLRFTDRSTDEDDPIVSRSWDFGDGNFSNESAPSHRFTEPGVHTIRLTVTDARGATDTHTKTVTIYDALRATVALEPREAHPQAPVVLAITSRWDNGTGAPASLEVTIVYRPPLWPRVPEIPYAVATGRANATGEALVVVPPLRGLAHLPGTYHAAVRATAMSPYAGQLRVGTASVTYVL